jgi:hypothetical protein
MEQIFFKFKADLSFCMVAFSKSLESIDELIPTPPELAPRWKKLQ